MRGVGAVLVVFSAVTSSVQARTPSFDRVASHAWPVALAASSETFSDTARPGPPDFKPPKGQGAAILWTLGVTAVPVAAGAWMNHKSATGHDDHGRMLLVGGILLGPSAGQMYAEAPGGALLGVVLRIGGFAIGSALASLDCIAATEECGGGESAIVLMAPGIIYSMLHASMAVQRVNERAKTAVSFTPTLVPVGDGRTAKRWAPGLAMSASF